MVTPLIAMTGRGLPPFYLLHGPPGIGKSSLLPYVPGCIAMQSKGETGLETLIDAGQVPETAHFEGVAESWQQVLKWITWLLQAEHNYTALGLDTLNGLLRLCHEQVCKKEFGNDWGENGFIGWSRGARTATADWRQFLNGLDQLRIQRKMTILALCHTEKVTFKNPEGPDYDRYEPDLDKYARALTEKQADAILFYNFHTVVETQKRTGKALTKGKASGGQLRFIHTVRHAAYEAKNRYGLPEEIDAGNSGKEAWDNFVQALIEAKNKKED
jgi:hypothetical protein